MSYTVVVPFYKSHVNSYESISLHRCVSVFGCDRITLISPEHLDMQNYRDFKIARFADAFFSSVSAYNRLMLSSEFYDYFADYKYMLIHQLDAFVFYDDINYWIDKNYDYIGAPWLGQSWPRNLMFSLWKPIWARSFLYRQLFENVNIGGNGGLSLRKVASARMALNILRKYANNWDCNDCNEDVFWSIFVPYVLPYYKVPDEKESAYFSLEQLPRIGFEMNGGKLPFGCHAWEKWDIEFWRPHFAAYGYAI